MLRQFLLIALLGTTSLTLAACGDGNPFYPPDSDGDGIPDDEDDDDDDADGGDNPGDPDETGNATIDTGTVRPGTGSTPRPANGSIDRAEAQEDGGGRVSSVTYDGANDRFIVNGLAFDGANTYSRGSPVGQLGSDDLGYAVYEADVVVTDPVSGNPIGQIAPYRAIYGVSVNDTSPADARPRTSFAIVRTGGYVGYGFGGFLYSRNGSVTLPTTGQAVFFGEYAGIRVFDGRSGVEYTTGDAEVQIDFRDFDSPTDDNPGVWLTVSNRQAFDEAGNGIPLGTTLDDGLLLLPDLSSVIEAGGVTLTRQGEIGGEIRNSARDANGQSQIYEDGHYYGIVAGDLTTGGEVVGIIVVESDDPRYEGVTVQETGGFIVYR